MLRASEDFSRACGGLHSRSEVGPIKVLSQGKRGGGGGKQGATLRPLRCYLEG